ncbi:MAG TPA: hypothetical protein PKD24_14455 [Pyrinomonadaceae bacterium]|nr:hypothetical protein [Pyrinomonadaceae bacterium]HMP66242.1 hypothetical protein [Pyrinomonadaceae bacterium]
MPSIEVRALASFIFLALLATACGGGTETANDNTVPFPKRPEAEDIKANNNTEELAMLVDLPFEPTEVVWREIGGKPGEAEPSERRLLAVMRFDPADAKKLTDAAGQSGEPASGTIDVEDWFPQELVAMSEVEPEAKLPGKVFSADKFSRQPYSTGTLTHVADTDYFVLELRAR